METGTARIIVRIASVLSYIGAAALTLGAIAFFALGFMIPMEEAGGFAPVFALLGPVVGVVFLALAALSFAMAYGLWQEKNWARILLLVVSVLGLIGDVAGIFMADINILNIIIHVALIYLFGFQKDVVGLFKEPVRKATAAKKRK